MQPHQGKFCEEIGVPRNRQSFIENGERELRAEYLDLVSRHGLDINYVLTGRRGGEMLSFRESMLLDAFRAMDDLSRGALLLTAVKMAPGAHFTPRAIVEEMMTAIGPVGAGDDVEGEETKEG